MRINQIRHALREMRGNLTLEQLSDVTGLSASHLSTYETGTRIPRLIQLQKIADMCGYNLEIILEPKNGASQWVHIDPERLQQLKEQLEQAQEMLNSILPLERP